MPNDILKAAVNTFALREEMKNAPFWPLRLAFRRLSHIFGCPKKHLTAPYKVRFCRKCGRLQGDKNAIRILKAQRST